MAHCRIFRVLIPPPFFAWTTRPKWPCFHAWPHLHPHPHPDTKNTASLAAFFMFGYMSNPHPIPSMKNAAEMASFFRAWPLLPSFTSPVIRTKMWPNRLHFLCCVPILSLSHISPMSRVLFVYIIVSSHRNIISSAGKTSVVRFFWNDNILSLSGLIMN